MASQSSHNSPTNFNSNFLWTFINNFQAAPQIPLFYFKKWHLPFFYPKTYYSHPEYSPRDSGIPCKHVWSICRQKMGSRKKSCPLFPPGVVAFSKLSEKSDAVGKSFLSGAIWPGFADFTVDRALIQFAVFTCLTWPLFQPSHPTRLHPTLDTGRIN